MPLHICYALLRTDQCWAVLQKAFKWQRSEQRPQRQSVKKLQNGWAQLVGCGDSCLCCQMKSRFRLVMYHQSTFKGFWKGIVSANFTHVMYFFFLCSKFKSMWNLKVEDDNQKLKVHAPPAPFHTLPLHCKSNVEISAFTLPLCFTLSVASDMVWQ